MAHADERPDSRVSGVILAGGRARRMGGQDKGLVELAGVPMVRFVLEALQSQVAGVLINANRNLERYAQLGVPVIADAFEGYLGPLAGMASAVGAVETEYLVTVPCDSPFLPADLVQRMYSELRGQGAQIAVAHDGERMQPVFTLLPTEVEASLVAFLDAGGRKIDHWYQRHELAIVDFSDQPDTFLNINTEADRDAVERRLRQRLAP